ncbi:MAG TPA: FMN-binding protein [Firmicutes bacterium]|nr:FMN-binding protein [Bacillota bacterium]
MGLSTKRLALLGTVVVILVAVGTFFMVTSASSQYRDGSWVGIVKDAARGDTVVEVVIKDGKIADVNIIMPTEEYVKGEKYAPALEAYTNIPKAIVAKQSPDVDVVSKATGSSKKYIQAVKMALANAQPKGPLPKGAKWHDGSYVGFVKDPKHGDTIVEVVIKGGKMTEVNVISPTAKYMSEYKYEPGKEAYKEMPRRILEAQSPDVDIYTKATSSSKKYIEAVKLALKQAE